MRFALSVALALVSGAALGQVPAGGACRTGQWCVHVRATTLAQGARDTYSPQTTESACHDTAMKLSALAAERNAKVPAGGQIQLVECVQGN